MIYKVIPQVEFDRAVQRILSVGLSRAPAENIAIALWHASIDLGLNFKVLIDTTTSSGNLEVMQDVLDRINLNLSDTIRYYKVQPIVTSPIVAREF